MQIYLAILRGINVSGQKKILMADLKELFDDLKYRDVKTYIQSGNVVFKTALKSPDLEIAGKIQKAIEKKYHFHVPVVIRTKEELKSIIASNPFLKERDIDLKKLHVTFLSEMPAEENAESITNSDFSPDRFRISGKEVYLHIPESYGETKLSNNFFDKKLKVAATTRNWNTVNKLFEIALSIS